MNEMDLAFKKTHFFKSSTLDGLEYEINYRRDRGWFIIGSVFKDGDMYVQQMGHNAEIPY